RAFTPAETVAWFAAMGVELKEEPGGKLFPLTDSAETVLAALLAECARVGVVIESGARVVRLETHGAGAPAKRPSVAGAAPAAAARACATARRSTIRRWRRTAKRSGRSPPPRPIDGSRPGA